MIPLLGALAAAVAAVTTLHLRSRPRGGASPFPSFQHLEGLAPRRRPAGPLEQPLRWALRVLALCLAACALLLSRRVERRTLVLLVEPGSPMWTSARDTVRAATIGAVASAPSVALTFEGDRPVVEASPKSLEAGERSRRSLARCSATFQVCLVRAALAVAGDAVVVSSFRERADTFAALGKFRYVRSPTPWNSPEKADPGIGSPKVGSTRVFRTGKSPATRIWAAALETVEGEMGGGETEIAVVDRAEDADGSRLSFVPVLASGALSESASTGSVALGEDAALIAGTSALSLDSSLTLRPNPSLRPLVSPVLAVNGRSVLAAATEEDLGSWAHSSVLQALAKLVLFESGRRLRVTEASAGTHRWVSMPSGEKAPVGILDVAPGHYERDDRRVELFVSRTLAHPGTPTDADLASVGGRRLDGLPAAAAPSHWPVALLAAALALRLADAPARGSYAWLFFSFVALTLVFLTIDASVLRHVAVPPETPHAVVASTGRPQVNLASWELPAETRLGEAGLLRATLVARGARGREVELTVRPTSGPSARVSRRVSSEFEALTLSLPVSAATEGISFALVRAAVGGDGDAVVVPLLTRARVARRVVLAAAPTWEARAAGEALAKRGAVERITRLGARSFISRGAASREPLDVLAGNLSKVDLIVLCGFTREDLAGAREAALSRFVRAGGAVLFAGGVPRLSSLPVPATAAGESSLPSKMTGTLGGKTYAFLGFPPWRTTLPTAGIVLGRLDGVPWVVGRAIGLGRIAAITAPDAWRAGAPGSGAIREASYEAFLGDVVAWLEAGRAGAAPVLSPDLRALGIGSTWIPLPATSVAGLPVDPVDPFGLLPPGLGRERVLARRAGVPFLTASSEAELVSLRARIPAPANLPRRIFARDLDAIWLALCALLVLEVAIRRRAA